MTIIDDIRINVEGAFLWPGTTASEISANRAIRERRLLLTILDEVTDTLNQWELKGGTRTNLVYLIRAKLRKDNETC